MRLEQNLKDVSQLTALVSADLQSYWDCYKSALQVKPKLQHVPVRVSDKKFCHHVYCMEPFLGMETTGDADRVDDGAGDEQAEL